MPFLSHSTSIMDAAIAARLRAVAALNDVSLDLPERGIHPLGRASRDSRTKIDRTDVVIGLITLGSEFMNDVIEELNYAISHKKPVVLLVESGVAVNVPPGLTVVNFNRLNPEFHERQLVQALKQIQEQNRNSTWWLAAIALGLLGLKASSAKPGAPRARKSPRAVSTGKRRTR